MASAMVTAALPSLPVVSVCPSGVRHRLQLSLPASAPGMLKSQAQPGCVCLPHHLHETRYQSLQNSSVLTGDLKHNVGYVRMVYAAEPNSVRTQTCRKLHSPV